MPDTPSTRSVMQTAREAREVQLNNMLKTEGMGDVGRAILASFGIGAAARGMMGLSQLLSTQDTKRKLITRQGTDKYVSTLPIPQYVDDDEEDPSVKIAKEEHVIDPTGGSGIRMTERGPEPPDGPIRDQWLNYKKPDRGGYGFLMGDQATKPSGIPWYIPGITLGAAGGLYGGFKLVDWLVKKRQKDETEAELEEAKDRYQSALMSQYSADNVEKWSSDNQLGQELDRLYHAVKVRTNGNIKQAAFFGSNLLGTAAGSYGVLASLLALGAGVGTYKYVKSRSPEERLKKVLEQRERERWLRKPPEMYATSERVPVTRVKNPSAEEEEEQRLLDESFTRKTANFVSSLVSDKS